MKIFKTEKLGDIAVCVDEDGGWIRVRDLARALGYRDSYCITRMVNKDYLSNIKKVADGTTYELSTAAGDAMKTISLTGAYIVLASTHSDAAAEVNDFINGTVKPYVEREMEKIGAAEVERLKGVYEIEIYPFPGSKPDKAHALKPLEEAAEAFGAWQQCTRSIDYIAESCARRALIDECCDTIQAACNLLAAAGCTQDELSEAVDRMHVRNEDRGRYQS